LVQTTKREFTQKKENAEKGCFRRLLVTHHRGWWFI